MPDWWVDDYWSKWRCRTNFLSAFAHFLMIFQHHKVSFTPSTAYGHAEFFFCSTTSSKGVGCLSNRVGIKKNGSLIYDRPIYWGLDPTKRMSTTARTLVTARTPATEGRKATAGTPQWEHKELKGRQQQQEYSSSRGWKQQLWLLQQTTAWMTAIAVTAPTAETQAIEGMKATTGRPT
jgi:hypothetical protein